jgi:hypothetical protein
MRRRKRGGCISPLKRDAKSPLTFVSERGAPFSTSGLAKLIERAGIEAKLPFNRLRPGEQGNGHKNAASLSWPSQHSINGQIYRVGTGALQEPVAMIEAARIGARRLSVSPVGNSNLTTGSRRRRRPAIGDGSSFYLFPLRLGARSRIAAADRVVESTSLVAAIDAALPAIAAGKIGGHYSFGIDEHLVNSIATIHEVN